MRKIGLITVVLLVAFDLMLPMNLAFAEDSTEHSAKDLGAQWWQWVNSIPRTVNPVLDLDGKNCVVGQRGDVWFLGGNFTGFPQITRTCSVPEGKALFFPVVNNFWVNTPNTCGQGPESLSVKAMRAANAAIIDTATSLSVTLDGTSVDNIRRVRSRLFEISLPKDNLYDSPEFPCAAGVYSPVVDEGYYVRIESLNPGSHELHIQAAVLNQGVTVTEDVTYHLNVVPVRLK
jgi:hypothetical protein